MSDRIGRKPIILAGCLLAAVTFLPVFGFLTKTANPAICAAHQTSVTVTVNAQDCSFQLNPTSTAKFTSSCDIAKAQLARTSVNYTTVEGAAPGTLAVVKVGDTQIQSYDAGKLTGDELKKAKATFDSTLNAALKQAGYPLVPTDNKTIAKAQNFVDLLTAQKITIILILASRIVLLTMVYGPIAAILVGMFPTRIRYSGLSLLHHIGNGWFGGLMPATAFAISAQTGNTYSGLWCAIVVAVMTVVIGMLFVPGGHPHEGYLRRRQRPLDPCRSPGRGLIETPARSPLGRGDAALSELVLSQLTDLFRIGLIIAVVVTMHRIAAVTGRVLRLFLGVVFVAVMLPATMPSTSASLAHAAIAGLVSNSTILVPVHAIAARIAHLRR